MLHDSHSVPRRHDWTVFAYARRMTAGDGLIELSFAKGLLSGCPTLLRLLLASFQLKLRRCCSQA
eukprot:COSAG02_NODE_20048_length_850_cov_1.394141_1_plen_64_part_01